jgi:hypothetical protein
MDQALANALKRRKELELELNKLNQFIHMYHELAGTRQAAGVVNHNHIFPHSGGGGGARVVGDGGIISNHTHSITGTNVATGGFGSNVMTSENSGLFGSGLLTTGFGGSQLKPRGRPADFARIMEDILKDVGYPLQRGMFVEEVEKRGHMIPSEDKGRYLGTILWRHSDVFESVEGRGYWLKGVRVPDPDLEELERNMGTPDP